MYIVVQERTNVYTSGMSKGITKIQLALSVAKGKRIALLKLKRELQLNNTTDPQVQIDNDIRLLDREIKEIEGNVPKYVERQHRGLIS